MSSKRARVFKPVATRTPKTSRSRSRGRMVMYKSPFRKSRYATKVWSFKRHATPDQLTFTTTASGGHIPFSLSVVAGHGEFVAMFDSYRINKVVVRFRPVFGQLNVNTNGATPAATQVPMVGVATDYDSVSTNPTSMATLREYDNATIVPATTPITRVLVPRTAVPVYRDGVNWAYSLGNRKLWLDCKNSDVPHYGLVWYKEAATADCYRYEITYTYYLSFRGLT